MSTISRRLHQLATPHRTTLGGTISAGLLNGLATVGAAYALSHLIDGVFLQQATLSTLLPTLLFWAGAVGLRSAAVWLQETLGSRLAQSVKTHLRHQLIAHLQRLGPAYLKREHPGELVTTLLTGVDNLEAYFSQYLPQMALAAGIPLLILLIVFPLDLLSGIVFLFTAPLIPLFMYLIGSMARQKTQQQWRTLQRLGAYFLDVIMGLPTLKIFNQSKQQAAIVARYSQQFQHHTMQVLRIAFLSAMVLEILASISTAIIAVEVGLRLLYAKMAFQEALFILLLAPEFYLPMRLLGTRYHAGMEGVAAAERIFAILDTPAPAIQTSRTRAAFSLEDVHFRDVTLQIPGRPNPILHNIHLTIPAGKLTVLLGPSGSGKTTLTDLLLKFQTPSSGTISVGTTPLDTIPPEEWYPRVVRVSQHPHIFHTTLRENLTATPVDEAALWKALEIVELNQWARQLPNGLDTPLGEQGARLSGGQQQRLALARALLKPAHWIILDEPTANLDAATEARLLPRLLEYWRERTVILITHQLRITRQAHQVVLLNRGRIEEQGAPEKLLQQPSRYRELMKAGGLL